MALSKLGAGLASLAFDCNKTSSSWTGIPGTNESMWAQCLEANSPQVSDW